MRMLAVWAALAVVVFLLLPVLAVMALAQDVVIAAPPEPSLWAIFAEPIGVIVSTIVGLALLWLTPKLAALIGQDQANKIQAALQAAADRAAGVALLRLTAGQAYQLPGPVTEVDMQAAVAEGVAYLKKTMPDTIARLGAGDDALRKIVEANLGLKIGGGKG